jgi:hypothetical protein
MLNSPSTSSSPALMRTVPWERALGSPASPTESMPTSMVPPRRCSSAVLVRPTRRGLMELVTRSGSCVTIEPLSSVSVPAQRLNWMKLR